MTGRKLLYISLTTVISKLKLTAKVGWKWMVQSTGLVSDEIG